MTRTEQRKSRILEAAEQLIGVRGFDALRLRDVATECAVSIGTLQHHFATRDSLVQSAVTAASRRRALEWATFGADIADPPERLVALLAHSVESRTACAMWLETCSASTRHQQLRADVAVLYDSWRAAVRDTIEAGRRTGAFDPVASTTELVDTFTALIDGCMQAVALNLVAPRDVVDLLTKAAGGLLAFTPPTSGVAAGS